MLSVLIDPLLGLSRTRFNYWLEAGVDTLLGILLLVAAIVHPVPLPVVGGLFAAGIGLFSLIEYAFHRWLFHGPVKAMAQGHASHHADPSGYDSLPFFLPGLILFGITVVLSLAMPWSYAWVVSSGIILGYVTYGLVHFTIHHRRFSHPWVKQWAARHHIHHYHPEANYGVTSGLWDFILGTQYKSASRKRA